MEKKKKLLPNEEKFEEPFIPDLELLRFSEELSTWNRKFKSFLEEEGFMREWQYRFKYYPTKAQVKACIRRLETTIKEPITEFTITDISKFYDRKKGTIIFFKGWFATKNYIGYYTYNPKRKRGGSRARVTFVRYERPKAKYLHDAYDID